MNLRKTILRVILWSLGVSAVVGAAAILTGSNRTIDRTLVTGFTTAGAAILLYFLSPMIDRKPMRPAGLFGMSVIVGEYLAILALTWLIHHTAWDDEVLESIIAVGFVGMGAFVFLLMQARDTMRVAARFGCVVAGVVLCVFLAAIWWPSGWPHRYDLWESPWPIILYSLLIVAALIGFGDRKHWRWLGIVCAAAAIVIVEYDMWYNPATTQLGRNVFTLTTAVACVVAHANLVLRAAVRDNQRWLTWGTIGAGIATGSLLCVAVFIADHDLDESTARLAGAAGVLAACGSLALVVLARFNRGINAEPGSAAFTDINLTCPRCQRKQTLPLGGGRCGACDLRITIEVEEPRCGKCGYLLYQLTSNACPECGERIGVKH